MSEWSIFLSAWCTEIDEAHGAELSVRQKPVCVLFGSLGS